MNQDVKTKWVAALRSGEYTQALGQLRYIDKVKGPCHCCLGVLTDLCAIDLGLEWKQVDMMDALSGLLAKEVKQWSGFEGWNLESEAVEIDGDLQHLARHNDAGRSFAQIADAIEAQL